MTINVIWPGTPWSPDLPSVVTVVSPVGAGHQIDLIAGDDYYAVDNRALDFTSLMWPDLTGATISFVAQIRAKITIVATLLSASSVRVELSSVNTTAIGTGAGTYEIRAVLADLHVVTLVAGQISVTTKVTS